jgi:peptidoglycan/LPS O-acetylase OafA/YrhL
MLRSLLLSDQQRVAVLDLFRCVAITLVVLGHGVYLIDADLAVGLGALLGMLGVDLFFVLSGYLMASLTVTPVSTGGFEIGRFLLRRWIRTVPLYLLFLALNAAFYSGSEVQGQGDWRYLAFLQSLVTPHPHFFPEAWSLVVEEWFYLLVAIGACAAARARSLRLFNAFVLGIAALSIAARAGNVYLGNEMEWAEGYRKIAIFRLDSLAAGALAYPVAQAMRNLALRRRLIALCISVLLLVSLALIYSEGKPANVVIVMYPTCLSAAAAMTLALAVAVAEGRIGDRFARLAHAGASWSYAMYLSNFPLLVVFAAVATALHVSGLAAYGALGAYLCTVCAVGCLVHRMFERPLLSWRDRRWASARHERVIDGAVVARM